MAEFTCRIHRNHVKHSENLVSQFLFLAWVQRMAGSKEKKDNLEGKQGRGQGSKAKSAGFLRFVLFLNTMDASQRAAFQIFFLG